MPGFSPRSDWVNLPSTLTHIDAVDLLRYEAGIANIDVTFLPCDVVTITAITLSGTGQTVNGVVITAGMRVLNKDDTTASNRGIYVAGAGAWARGADMPAGATIKSGCTVIVRGGTIGAGTKWVITQASGAATAVIGTDGLAIAAVVAAIPGPAAFTVKATNPGGTQLYLTGLNDSPMDGIVLSNGDLVYYRHDGVPGDSGVFVVNSTGNWSRYSKMAVGMTFPSGLLIRIQQGVIKGGVTYVTRAHSGAATYTINTYPNGEIIDIDEIPAGAPTLTNAATSGGNYQVSATTNGYSYILLTGNAVVAFLETPDNLARQFHLVIEQDSVGGHQVAWSPQTIAWHNGVQPIIDSAPGAVTYIRAAWLGTSYGMFAEVLTGVGQYIRQLPDPYKGVTLGFPMYVMRYMSSASIDNIINTLNRWTTTAHRQLMGTNGGKMYWSDGFDTDTPVGQFFRGGVFETQGGFNTSASTPPGLSTVGTNPLPFSDASIHEYFHMEHNFLFPSGYSDPGGTVGTANFTPYATAVSAIGYTVPITMLNHPFVMDCWIRAYNNVTTRTVTGCSTTSGSTTVTTTSSFTAGPGGAGNPNGDGSNDTNGNPYVLAGIAGAGIPAPSRTVSSVVTYNGFNIITFPSGQITNTDVGSQITGTGIPSNTGIVSVDTTNNRATISHLATAGGTITATITNQTRVTTVNSSTQITLSAAANVTGSGVTLTITYPIGNNSAEAEWWSQMRTAKHAQSDGVLNTEQNVAGGLAAVVTDFENFITHINPPGG